LTDNNPFDNSLESTAEFDKVSNLHLFLYYLSFVLVYATLAFISSMLMMGYEDRTGSLQWMPGDMKLIDQIGLIVFYVLQFPLGLLFGLFTGNFHNGLFAFVINPLLIGWTLNKLFFKTERIFIKRILLINYSVWTALVLTIVIYIVTE
jgi:hypothetical protein